MHENFVRFQAIESAQLPEEFGGKNGIAAPSILSKILSMLSHKVSILHENFVRFHAVELSQEMWEKRNNSTPH